MWDIIVKMMIQAASITCQWKDKSASGAAVFNNDYEESDYDSLHHQCES